MLNVRLPHFPLLSSVCIFEFSPVLAFPPLTHTRLMALLTQLYRLRDPETRVRKNALMVLTHLILNDMVKVKGHIAEMAVCLEDPDRRIADLAR
jgi:hypothetical protein